MFCLILAAVLFASAVAGVAPIVSAASGDVTCFVRFSKPAICCDAGQSIDLAACGVQFSADTPMVTDGIVWTENGAVITSFTPVEKGVYALTARSGNSQMTVYVVAKNPAEEEYVLYRNDFDTAPGDFRVIEQANGSKVSVNDGAYILDGSGHKDGYVRILLPEFLDAFGDAKMEAGLSVTAAIDARKWASMMYRVQSGNYPYYQCCFRYDPTVSDGVEISQRNASYAWEVYRHTSFSAWNQDGYNVCAVSAKGTESVLTVNGYQVASFANTGFANGGFGFQVRGTRLSVDYVKITIDGNDPAATGCDVSFSKPAIRADMGDTVDLTACDVQMTADAVYTPGSSITWQRDGKQITAITPSAPGVIRLTATSGGITKNVYVVTRSLNDSEYVLYYNDFSAAPTDWRIVQQTGASIRHDGDGHYVIDASSGSTAYGRVLLPSFLDDFGDFKFEARYKDDQQKNARCWSSLMGRVQNADYPYMQMCVRYDTTPSDGIEIAHRNQSDKWDVWARTAYTGKVAGNYNVYTLHMQGNRAWGFVNGEQVITYDSSLYTAGAMGLQAKGLKITVDYVKVTLGSTTALEDTAVKCVVSKTRPAIGCDAGQTILLDECDVQFTYGFPAVDGSQIVWKKDGKVITEFSDTALGIHKLTATHGDTTMDVYVVPKRSLDNHYTLYYNDFSTAPTDFRVPDATNGGSCYQQNGNFVLNGSSDANSYVRVLLPAWLDAFGDATLETSIKLSAATDPSKWGAVVYRVQSGNYPYMQACIRYNAVADSGVEISLKNAANKWEVFQKKASSAMVAGDYNRVAVDTHCKNTDFAINGNTVLTHSATPYYNGGWGFHVRGLTMAVDKVSLTFTDNYTAFDLYTVSGHYADVRDPVTGINIAPALITEVKTRADFDHILEDSPAVAIFTYDVVGGEARIVLRDGIVSPEMALNKLGGKVIPAFRINDLADADSLAAFLIGHDHQDAFVVSSNPAAVKGAYEKWKYIRGVVDYSDLTDFVPEDIRYEAMANSARVVILPESASKQTVTAIQDSFSCVWILAGEGKTASVAAINKGPYGIITPDRTLTEECYGRFYGLNTLLRRTNVIGHRGNPSVAQENTIAGMKTAFANGATAVENDIYRMTDGVLMVMHDKTIDRSTKGSGKTVDFSSTQLKKYVVDVKAGLPTEPIPSLEDYFRAVKDQEGQRLVVEIKHPDTTFAAPFAEMIKKYDIMDQMTIIGFDAANLQAIRAKLPGAPVGLLKRFVFNEAEPVMTVQSILNEIQTCNSVCNPGYTAMEGKMIRSFIYRGVSLWPWTVNDRNTFDTLMVKGVGGITTDYSQWSKDMVASLEIAADGTVVATTYGGSKIDVTAHAELVVIEDTIGISDEKGRVAVPAGAEGHASYFFRYQTATPTGIIYHVVTDVMEAGSDQQITVAVEDLLDAQDAKIHTTTTPSTVFSPAPQPFVQNQRYLIMSDKYGYIMSYDPIRYSSAATTGSLTLDPDGDSENTYYFSGANVIIEHSDRENAMWILRQYPQGSGGTQIPDWNKLVVSGATSFGGQAYYPGIELQKGKYGESGVTYWSSTGGSNEYRYLCYRSDSTPFKNDADQAALTDAASRPKYIIESFGDGTYLIYFKASNTDYRFVCCDANGVWGVRRYADGISGCSPVSQVKTDMQELKIRLYEHVRDASATKRVAFCGYQTYRVDGSATKEAVLDTIAQHITVYDPDLKSLHIPCSSTQTKVGYYRLAFTNGFNPKAEGTYPVQIIYRAEANKLGVAPNDVILGTVNVVVHNHSYETVVTQPDCTTPGSIAQVCTGCGDSVISEEIPAVGHQYIWDICSVCGAVDENYVKPTYCLFGYINGANYGCEEDDQNMGTYWFVDGQVSAVFKQDSYVAVKTVGNGHWYMTDGWQGMQTTAVTLYATPGLVAPDKLFVPANTHVTFTLTENSDGTLTLRYERTPCNHNYEETGRMEATCTEQGQVSYHCTICSENHTDMIPATGHHYVWDTCSVCGYVDEAYVMPQYYLFGHINGANYACEEDHLNMGIYKFDGNKLHAIFLQDSYVAVKTENNGRWYMTDGWQGNDATSAKLYDTAHVAMTADKLFIPAKTHVILTIDHNPDATLTLRYEIAADAHCYDAVVTVPTCVTGGYTTYTCVCGSSYVDGHEAAYGHSYETVTVAPSCLKDGSTTRTCDICGDTETQVLAATGHSYASVVTKPTCTDVGYTTYTCANCTQHYVADEVLPTGHHFTGGVCDVCATVESGSDSTTIACALIGDMNGWNETVSIMGGDGIRSVTMNLSAGTYQFKVKFGGIAYGNDGIIVNTTDSTSADGWLMNTEGGNCTLVASGGHYRFTFDPQTHLMRVVFVDNETEDDTVHEGIITLNSMTLLLEDEIHYKLYFQVDNMSVSEEDMGMIIWDEEPVLPTIHGGGTVIAGAVFNPVNGCYGVSSMGIPAKNMGDVKYLVAYAKQPGGNYVYSRVLQYSARTYCLNRVHNSTNEKMRALCVALMNYGAEAQKHFAATSDYTYTELMNVGFEQYQYLVKPYSGSLVNKVGAVGAVKAGNFGTTAKGFDRRSVTVSANGAFALNYYFMPSASAEKVTCYYWTAAQFASVSVLTAENASGSMEMTRLSGRNEYWACIDGIAAKEIDQPIYVCGVYEVDGVMYSTGVIPYSVATYCVNKASGESAIKYFAEAMVVYGYHAKTYFGL